LSTITHPTQKTSAVPAPSPLRRLVARTILATVLRRVPVRILLPGDDPLGVTGPGVHPDTPAIEIVRPERLLRRLARNPKIGIGEAYMAGEWRVAPGTDLASALLPFAQQVTTAVPPTLRRLRWLVDRRIPFTQRNTITGARRNIRDHYDLSNDLFAAFLDETLSYSSARFDDGRPWTEQSLAEAQLRKVNAVLDLAGVGPGSTVLEIGTGWGTLAIEAARRGATVTSITISAAQADLARARVRHAGVAGSVDIRLQDYREITGRFDAVVSVEMIEAVGEEYWPEYFAALDRLLAPGGTVALQSILMSHDRYLATRRSFGWIQKHIFPGGLIPSTDAIETTARSHTTLRVTEVTRFGQHYAETLRRWRGSFTTAWPHVRRLGFDETFRRKWEFYLAYCQAGFAAGYLDVAQIQLRRSQP
jgi:cyclopropane-fatty-acyl-phospholipid synthase